MSGRSSPGSAGAAPHPDSGTPWPRSSGKAARRPRMRPKAKAARRSRSADRFKKVVRLSRLILRTCLRISRTASTTATATTMNHETAMTPPIREVAELTASTICRLHSNPSTAEATIPPSVSERSRSPATTVTPIARAIATTSDRTTAYGLTAASSHRVTTMSAANTIGCQGNAAADLSAAVRLMAATRAPARRARRGRRGTGRRGGWSRRAPDNNQQGGARTSHRPSRNHDMRRRQFSGLVEDRRETLRRVAMALLGRLVSRGPLAEPLGVEPLRSLWRGDHESAREGREPLSHQVVAPRLGCDHGDARVIRQRGNRLPCFDLRAGQWLLLRAWVSRARAGAEHGDRQHDPDSCHRGPRARSRSGVSESHRRELIKTNCPRDGPRDGRHEHRAAQEVNQEQPGRKAPPPRQEADRDAGDRERHGDVGYAAVHGLHGRIGNESDKTRQRVEALAAR